jgi:hypothetical protein
VGEPVVRFLEVLFIRGVLRSEVVKRERLLQYGRQRDDAVRALAACERRLNEAVPVASETAPGKRLTLQVAQQGPPDVRPQLTCACNDLTELRRPLNDHDLRCRKLRRGKCLWRIKDVRNTLESLFEAFIVDGRTILERGRLIEARSDGRHHFEVLHGNARPIRQSPPFVVCAFS